MRTKWVTLWWLDGLLRRIVRQNFPCAMPFCLRGARWKAYADAVMTFDTEVWGCTRHIGVLLDDRFVQTLYAIEGDDAD